MDRPGYAIVQHLNSSVNPSGISAGDTYFLSRQIEELATLGVEFHVGWKFDLNLFRGPRLVPQGEIGELGSAVYLIVDFSHGRLRPRYRRQNKNQPERASNWTDHESGIGGGKALLYRLGRRMGTAPLNSA